MSANVPTDIVFSFTGFRMRGGKRGPHKDGWGISFYEGRGLRIFRDPSPSAESRMAKFVRDYPIKSKNVIAHIRRASAGKAVLENTHPFVRELWGREWAFAHNGRIPRVRKRRLRFYNPVGVTDSEHGFCWMLGSLREAFPRRPKNPASYWRLLEKLCGNLAKLGTFNMLLSDGEYLYAYATTRLHWIARRAPFSKARLIDEELEIDFAKETTPRDKVAVIATSPLTRDEVWERCRSREFAVFRDGERVL